MNANLESLLRKQGATLDKATPEQLRAAERDFREIADLGGYGSVSTSGEGHIHPAYAGGLDLAGVLTDSNTAVSEKAKARIAELTGVDRGKATELTHDEGHTTKANEGGTSSAPKMPDAKADPKV
jgi:hypothetical protein